MNWLKRLFCRHYGGVEFVRNLYGDEIMGWSGNRSLWRCKRCGGIFAQPELNEPPT